MRCTITQTVIENRLTNFYELLGIIRIYQTFLVQINIFKIMTKYLSIGFLNFKMFLIRTI